jgi:Flp pilus assembly protein TadD
MEWFDRGRKLNPWDSTGELGYGGCLDWLGRTQESDPCFDRAEQLDPNGFFTVANIGLHYFRSGDYAAARPWLERSLNLKGKDNPLASAYLAIVNQHLIEAATNEIRAALDCTPQGGK